MRKTLLALSLAIAGTLAIPADATVFHGDVFQGDGATPRRAGFQDAHYYGHRPYYYHHRYYRDYYRHHYYRPYYRYYDRYDHNYYYDHRYYRRGYYRHCGSWYWRYHHRYCY